MHRTQAEKMGGNRLRLVKWEEAANIGLWGRRGLGCKRLGIGFNKRYLLWWTRWPAAGLEVQSSSSGTCGERDELAAVADLKPLPDGQMDSYMMRFETLCCGYCVQVRTFWF